MILAQQRKAMMGGERKIEYINSSTNRVVSTVGGSTPITVTAPSGILNNGMLVLTVVGDAAGSVTVTPPSGFTQRYYDLNGGKFYGVWTKPTSGESGNYDIGWNTANANVRATMSFWKDAAFDTFGTVTNGNQSNMTGLGITPATLGTLLFLGARPSDIMTVNTPPSGMTFRTGVLNTNQCDFLYSLDDQAASATGDKVAALSNSRMSMSVLMQLKKYGT